MNETDAMRLLVDANPVRGEDRRETGLTVEAVLARRRGPRSRVVLVAVAVLVAAAVLAGVFLTGGHHAESSVGPAGLGRLGSSNASWKTIPLADASAALGAPLVLPNTSLVQPADAASEVRVADCSTSACTVFVSFPAQSLGVRYTRPVPFDPSVQWEADVRSAGSHHARARLVDLNGTPGDYIDYPGVKRLVEFVAGGTWIVVSGEYSEATLQEIAQSIVDEEPPSQRAGGALLGVGSPSTIDRPLFDGKKVTLPVAAAGFGAPIVQPDTSLTSASQAGPVWLDDSSTQVTTAAVTYPGAGVWVTYSWPASYDGGYDDRLLRYHSRDRLTHIVLLDGVPAQIVFHSWRSPRWSGFYPSVHFAAGGVEVSVEGRQNKASLEAIARSIVAQSEKPPAGQLGDVAGVQVYPYLRNGSQVSLSDTSETLGSQVVLPKSPLAPPEGVQAWAEGTCPHPAADLATTEVCAVWVSFGSELSIGYIRPPAYRGTGSEWRLQARGLGSHGSVVRLDGVPALSIHRNPRAGYPGRVELNLGGTRVVVAGDYSPAKLQEVARSIVARSR